ncbi:MAG TPA: AMIN domain-containing protein [bacterium]|nr:AMIN domain-containing protein [bacterium]
MNFFAIAVLCASATCLRAASDDETLSLSPVASARTAMASPQGGTRVATCAPHGAAAGMHGPALTGIEVSATDDGVRVLVKASGPLTGAAANLSSPDRVLIRVSGIGMASAKLPKVLPVHLGAVERVRYAVKSPTQVWVVVDLDARLAFRTSQPTKDSFELDLLTEASASAPEPPSQSLASPVAADAHGLAQIPRINLMLFDLNVIYQGKKYDRFPCANFIYNAGERFPLKRNFVSTLVFSHGYGAFVGNARILDPQGRMLAQTETPFAFNLFNPLTEFMVELPWNVVFAEKGMYTLWVELSGSDVLKQSFYVGQTTDRLPAD